MADHMCPYCNARFDTGNELADHLTDEGVYDDVTRGVIRHAGR